MKGHKKDWSVMRSSSTEWKGNTYDLMFLEVEGLTCLYAYSRYLSTTEIYKAIMLVLFVASVYFLCKYFTISFLEREKYVEKLTIYSKKKHVEMCGGFP